MIRRFIDWMLGIDKLRAEVKGLRDELESLSSELSYDHKTILSVRDKTLELHSLAYNRAQKLTERISDIDNRCCVNAAKINEILKRTPDSCGKPSPDKTVTVSELFKLPRRMVYGSGPRPREVILMSDIMNLVHKKAK